MLLINNAVTFHSHCRTLQNSSSLKLISNSTFTHVGIKIN